MTGRVGIARVERGRERLYRADVGQLGLRFGGLQRGHHLVEGIGEGVELETGSECADLPGELMVGGDDPQLLRQLIDRFGQHTREPQADQRAAAPSRRRRQCSESGWRCGGAMGRKAQRLGAVDVDRAAVAQAPHRHRFVGEIERAVEREFPAAAEQELRSVDESVLPMTSSLAMTVTDVRSWLASEAA